MGFFDDNSGKFNWFGGGSNNSNPLEAYNNNLGFNNNCRIYRWQSSTYYWRFTGS